MTTATDASDLDLEADLDPADAPADAKKGGFFRSVFRLLTAPFRLVAWFVRAVVAVLGVLVSIVMIPIKVATAAVRAVVGLAADIVYGLWRLVLLILGALIGTVKFVLAVLNATVGAAIRLIIRILLTILKLLVRVFTLGKVFGKASAKASEADKGRKARKERTKRKTRKERTKRKKHEQRAADEHGGADAETPTSDDPSEERTARKGRKGDDHHGAVEGATSRIAAKLPTNKSRASRIAAKLPTNKSRASRIAAKLPTNKSRTSRIAAKVRRADAPWKRAA